MKKFNLIILAGGEEEHWCRNYGYNKKAFLPLLGRPMLGWVIQAFRNSQYIDKIIVIGPRELNQLDSMRYVHRHLSEGKSFIHNLLKATFYMKRSIYKFSNTHNGYLISFCDAAFLTTSIIDSTLKNISEHDPGVALHYVQRETIARGGHPVENRSFMNIANRFYTGSNMYYIKKLSKLLCVLKGLC